MTSYYYEPFYNFDRFFDEFFGRPQNNNNRIQGAQSPGAEGVTSVALRPKYVYLPPHLIFDLDH